MSGVKHTPVLIATSSAADGVYVISQGEERKAIGTVRAPRSLVDTMCAAPDLLEALIEARLTLSLTRTNIMVEMKKSEGAAYRWEGVPELLANRIAQCDAAIARARGEQDGGGE
ncbi:hypothetical protein [Brevundimonas diminuta]|uniref:hypothetical protein n=1 Tax=Brevundimonas diminuta TaxID=293 RepID=UPI003F7DA780